MDKENSIKDLFKPNKCSPVIAYFLIILISIVMIINAKETTTKLQNNYKVLNVFKLFTYFELLFLLIHGIILFGLCQHGKDTLAWITLLFPLFGYLVKNIIVFISLYTIKKSEPPQDKIDNINNNDDGDNDYNSQQTQIVKLSSPQPPNKNVTDVQKQMLHFNQALQNNALQNIVNRDEMMNPPLDNNVHPMPSQF